MLAEHWLRKVLATDLLDPQLGPPAANVEKFRSPHQSEGSWAAFLESGSQLEEAKAGATGGNGQFLNSGQAQKEVGKAHVSAACSAFRKA